MRTNSLALRLFLSGGGWPGIILLIPGFVLSSLYRDAVERSFDRRLNVFLRTLVAEVAAPDDSSERTPQSLGEPQFDLPVSGLVRPAPPPQRGAAGGALVALAVGFRPAASRRHGGGGGRRRDAPRLCAGPGSPAPGPDPAGRRPRRSRP